MQSHSLNETLSRGKRIFDQNTVRDWNFTAGSVIGEVVKSTLGPQGMDKMLVDSSGMVVVTSNGSTILKEVDVEDPIAKLVVDLTISQENRVGDGTTSVAILMSELLHQARTLLEQGLHPTTITQGYHRAAKTVREEISEYSVQFDGEDEELHQIAQTVINGKTTSYTRDILSELVVTVARNVHDNKKINPDEIKIHRITGGHTEQSCLIDGILLDEEPAHPNMPFSVKDANVALFDVGLGIDGDFSLSKMGPADLDHYRMFKRQRENKVVESLINQGVDVVFTSGNIDETIRNTFSQRNILAFRRVNSDDLQHLRHACSAAILKDPAGFSMEDLGEAKEVSETFVSGNAFYSIKSPEYVKTSTLILQGSTDTIVDENFRVAEASLKVLGDTLQENRILPGGGAVEAQLSRLLRDYANTVDNRTQLAIKAYADALEQIPQTLARNAGMDPANTLINIHNVQRDGCSHAGVNCEVGKVSDMLSAGVIEPVGVKITAIDLATDLVTSLLRIDGILAEHDEYSELS
jgi:chaperonin GroEL (HSP60 family)